MISGQQKESKYSKSDTLTPVGIKIAQITIFA
jgi:hypothetical protein